MPKTMTEALAHADALAERIARDDYEPQIASVQVTDRLEGLAKAVIEAASGQRQVALWVELAREDGYTWTQIAEVLGVTPQSARTKFNALPNGRRKNAG